MKSVFILQHLRKLPEGIEDVKLIGSYSSEFAARQAIERLTKENGFSDFPKLIDPVNDTEVGGFHIDEYQIDEDNWKEGFTTV